MVKKLAFEIYRQQNNLPECLQFEYDDDDNLKQMHCDVCDSTTKITKPHKALDHPNLSTHIKNADIPSIPGLTRKESIRYGDLKKLHPFLEIDGSVMACECCECYEGPK